MKTLTHRFAFALWVALSFAIAACAQDPVAYDSGEYFYAPAQAAPLPSEQLEQLVAPIALYPDALVAQVLAASTYPDEIADAASWVGANSSLKGTQLAEAVNAQPWDPSVKALTQFPSVLSNLEENLSWTSALGDAYMNQPGEVMDAIQVLRRRAQAAGNLTSTSNQTVTTQGQSIVIQPANPAVVYVPAYDPWLAYGTPVLAYPGWVAVPGPYYAGPGVYWGLGFDVGLFAGFGWGWHHWGSDWPHHALLHDHAPWHSHSPRFAHFGRPDGRIGHPGFSGEAPHLEPRFEEHGGVAHDGGFARGGMPHEGGFAHGGGFHGGGFHGGGGGGHR